MTFGKSVRCSNQLSTLSQLFTCWISHLCYFLLTLLHHLTHYICKPSQVILNHINYAIQCKTQVAFGFAVCFDTKMYAIYISPLSLPRCMFWYRRNRCLSWSYDGLASHPSVFLMQVKPLNKRLETLSNSLKFHPLISLIKKHRQFARSQNCMMRNWMQNQHNCLAVVRSLADMLVIYTHFQDIPIPLHLFSFFCSFHPPIVVNYQPYCLAAALTVSNLQRLGTVEEY